MARTLHGFCSLHRIGYNRQYDATCPQCTIAHTQAEQLDFDPNLTRTVEVPHGAPVDAAGNPVDLETLGPR